MKMQAHVTHSDGMGMDGMQRNASGGIGWDGTTFLRMRLELGSTSL